MSIKAQIHHLVDLQRLEAETTKIKAVLETVPEKLDKLSHQRTEFEKRIESAARIIDTLKKQYRDGESDSQGIIDRIGKEEEKLRAVKNNKEYQALLAGIEHLKADQSGVEDRLLEILDEIESAEASLAEDRAYFSAFETELAEDEKVIAREAETARRSLDKIMAARAELETRIEPAYLEKFRRVQATKRGQAMAPVQDAMCKGCHMNIPPQLYNELQRFDQLLFCPRCQRIIYWEPESPPVEEENASQTK